jgi:hypothetical protein
LIAGIVVVIAAAVLAYFVGRNTADAGQSPGSAGTSAVATSAATTATGATTAASRTVTVTVAAPPGPVAPAQSRRPYDAPSLTIEDQSVSPATVPAGSEITLTAVASPQGQLGAAFAVILSDDGSWGYTTIFMNRTDSGNETTMTVKVPAPTTPGTYKYYARLMDFSGVDMDKSDDPVTLVVTP